MLNNIFLHATNFGTIQQQLFQVLQNYMPSFTKNLSICAKKTIQTT